MTNHQVVDSLGKTHKRSSINRVYAYATVTHFPAWRSPYDGKMQPAYSQAEWSSTLQNAEYAKRRSERAGRQAEIIAAVIVEPKPRKVEMWRGIAADDAE
jgi:hypothetical protein